MTGGAKRKVKGKLDCMFSHPWKTLTHLDLGEALLDTQDITCLSNQGKPSDCSQALPCKRTKIDVFPKLTSLVLRAPDSSDQSSFLSKAWCSMEKLHIIAPNEVLPQSDLLGKITELAFSNIHKESFDVAKLLESLDDRCKERIGAPTALKISSNQKIRGKWHLAKFNVVNKVQSLDVSNCAYDSSLCELLYSEFPHLYSFILRDCQLTNQDLLCLAQADFEGWLPNLELLDISNNREMGKLQSLFAYDNRWQNLKTLRT